jgi:hypothetical protein
MMSNESRWQKILMVSLMVIVFGSVWGFLEMTLGGLLHVVHFPQKGAVMGGLAISLMAVFVTVTGKPSLVPLLGIIAASFKPVDAVIFGVPALSPYIINPAIAIVTEAVAFGAVVAIMKRAMDKHLSARLVTGVLAGSSGYAFYAVLASVLGLGMWPTLDLAGKFQLIITSVAPIAAAGALTLAAGYYIGSLSAPRLFTIKKIRPVLYYSSSLAMVLLCWMVPLAYHPGV